MPQFSSDKSLVCPVQLDDSDVLVEDEFGQCNPVPVEEYTRGGRELVNLENSAVNIENSSDVVIGPVTNFNVNGNVTIYQNGQQEALEGREDISAQDGSEMQWESSKPTSILTFFYIHRKCIKISTLLSIALFTTTVIIIFLVKITNDYNYDASYNETKYGVTLGSHKLFYRGDWNGLPPREVEYIKHPVNIVIISHSDTKICVSFESCSEKVQTLQKYHMLEIGSFDIGYNFLIGNDGNIYVGTGWDLINYHIKSSIGIDFIGNFNFDLCTADMFDAAKMLLKQGLELGKISKDYKLVGENQTNVMRYLSPGTNVYKEIKKWPHFYNNLLFK